MSSTGHENPMETLTILAPHDEPVSRRIPPMNGTAAAPAQQPDDCPSIDATLCESLAHELHVSVGQVETIYRDELYRLSAGARIKAFIGLLAAHRVRVILGRLSPRSSGAHESAS